MRVLYIIVCSDSPIPFYLKPCTYIYQYTSYKGYIMFPVWLAASILELRIVLFIILNSSGRHTWQPSL